jgi:hypothetical protein
LKVAPFHPDVLWQLAQFVPREPRWTSFLAWQEIQVDVVPAQR